MVWREERGEGGKAELVVFKSSTLCGVGSFQFIFEFSINLDGQSKDPTTVRVRRVRVSQHFTMRDYLAGADTGYTYLHFHFSIHSIGNIISFIRSTKKKWLSFNLLQWRPITRHKVQGADSQTQSRPALSSVFLCLFVKNEIQGLQL